MKKIAIFASGSGSNAREIIKYFSDKPEIEVSIIISNRKSAGVLQIAKASGILSKVVSRTEFYDDQTDIMDALAGIDLIVLAGFLWMIPPYLIQAFPQRIINIHPALLPQYGGAGMYGIHVHRAVKESGDPISGMTIHYVNEKYDEGRHIFQAQCSIDDEDTPEEIASKVLKLEHTYFAPIIESILNPL